MTRVVLAIFVIVLLGVTIEGFDLRKLQSSSNHGQKRMAKRHSKRQILSVFSSGWNSLSSNSLSRVCDYNALNTCDNYIYGLSQSGSQLRNTMNIVASQNLFVDGRISISALQNGGMCMPNTYFFTANAFSALSMGHITPAQLAALNLFPVQNIDVNSLFNAHYLNTFGQLSVLSALGIQASMFGHIAPSQLQSISLYPLQTAGLTYDILLQSQYITADCLPSALGLSALHIHYLSSSSFSSYGCPYPDNFQFTITQLTTAKYIYGSGNLVTPVGLVAVRSGYLSTDTFRKIGVYPFAGSVQAQSVDYVYQEQPVSVSFSDLVHVGYVQKNGLLTYAASYAILTGYFTIDNLRSLSVWPYPGIPTINAFVSAGYATYSGHLTSLGYSLLHAQYFSASWLPKLGISLHDDFHLFHQALNYAGYFQSEYRRAHTAVQSSAGGDSVNEEPAAQVSENRSSTSGDVSTAADAVQDH